MAAEIVDQKIANFRPDYYLVISQMVFSMPQFEQNWYLSDYWSRKVYFKDFTMLKTSSFIDQKVVVAKLDCHQNYWKLASNLHQRYFAMVLLNCADWNFADWLQKASNYLAFIEYHLRKHYSEVWRQH